MLCSGAEGPPDTASPGVQAGKKRREDIGVELYNFQQQLAKLQMALEKTHDEYTNLHRNRLEARFKLTPTPGTYSTRLALPTQRCSLLKARCAV